MRFLLALFLAAVGSQEVHRPNVVLIVAEGLGYGDLGCYGQKILKTPRLDALATEGMRWTQFYAGAAIPEASRAALRTARHAGRAPSEGPTLMSLLEKAGYAVLDSKDPAAAVGFLREKREKPFLLCWTAPLPSSDDPVRAAGIGEFDLAVGRLLDAIKELGLEAGTLVVVTSDGGPPSEAFDANGPLRGLRGEITEGGLRVPMIARWPGTIAAGSSSDEHAWAGDLLPTFAEVAGTAVPAGTDGDSLMETLHGRPRKDRWRRTHELYWENATSQAARFGKWKAIRSPIGTGTIELYDMSNDPGEKRDYSVRRPDLTKHAAAVLDKRREPKPEGR